MALFSVKGRRFAILATLIVLISASAAMVVAMRNYRAARALLEADPPSALLDSPGRVGIAGLESVTFTSQDGLKISAWYAPPANGAAIIVTHGTNSDRSTMLPELRVLARAGYGLLAFDWPGLGGSEGTVRWGDQARHALTAAIDWLSARSEIDPRRIGGLGFSIGAFVMVQVAAEEPRLRAVVLEAPPPDFDDYIRLHFTHWGILGEWPARWAIRNSGLLDRAVAPLYLIDRISPRPVLLVAGDADTEVSPELVAKLYDAARDPKSLWVAHGARHGEYAEAAPAEYARRINAFFQSCLPRDGAGTTRLNLPIASAEFHAVPVTAVSSRTPVTRTTEFFRPPIA